MKPLSLVRLGLTTAIDEYADVGARDVVDASGGERGPIPPIRTSNPLAVKHSATPVLVLPTTLGGTPFFVEVQVAPEAGEAEQAVVKLVQPPAPGQGDLRGYVEARFAEHRIVLVLALLPGQPQDAREAVDRQVGGRDCRRDIPG